MRLKLLVLIEADEKSVMVKGKNFPVRLRTISHEPGADQM